MATIPTQSIVEAGLGATYSAADSEGDTFVNDGSNRQFLHVKNANAVDARTVTVTPSDASTEKPGYGALARAAIEVTVPAEGERFIGPFPATAFAEPAITYSSEADVTLAVLKI